jgi:hypothetical protein
VINPIPIVSGDAPIFRFEVRSSAGDLFDLTNYNINFVIKRSMQDNDSSAEYNGTFGDGVTLAFTAKDGTVDVTVPASVTSNLRIGCGYPYALVLTNEADSAKVFIPARGFFLPSLPESE